MHLPPQATLFGKPVMISRTGYTGERGYELFMKACDATPIWDGLLESGSDLGIMPCGFTALDLLRVESSLLFYPFDMSETYPDDVRFGLWWLNQSTHSQPHSHSNANPINLSPVPGAARRHGRLAVGAGADVHGDQGEEGVARVRRPLPPQGPGAVQNLWGANGQRCHHPAQRGAHF